MDETKELTIEEKIEKEMANARLEAITTVFHEEFQHMNGKTAQTLLTFLQKPIFRPHLDNIDIVLKSVPSLPHSKGERIRTSKADMRIEVDMLKGYIKEALTKLPVASAIQLTVEIVRAHPSFTEEMIDKRWLEAMKELKAGHEVETKGEKRAMVYMLPKGKRKALSEEALLDVIKGKKAS